MMNEKLEASLYIDEDSERELWNNCIVIFDTSALLSLYDYTDVFRTKFFTEVLYKFKDRLFITGHTEFEYFKNRKSKIDNPIRQKIKPFEESTFGKMEDPINEIEKTIASIKNETKKDDQVPFLNQDMFDELDSAIKSLKDAVKQFEETAKESLDLQTKEISKLKEDDVIFKKLKDIFMVGENYNFNQIIELIKDEGEFRHENKIPPGFMDNPNVNSKSNKIGTQIYGDLIIWKQVIDLANKYKTNVLFVTNDLKIDWCNTDSKIKTRILHPNLDLVREFGDSTGSNFWMYSISDILYFSNKYLDAKFTEEEIKLVDKLTISESLDVKVYSTEGSVIKCNRCGCINEYTPADLMIEFDSHGGSERSMGAETHFRSESYLTCNECSNTISLQLNIWEYPMGAHNYQTEEIDGGHVVTMYDYVTEFWTEREDREYPHT